MNFQSTSEIANGCSRASCNHVRILDFRCQKLEVRTVLRSFPLKKGVPVGRGIFRGSQLYMRTGFICPLRVDFICFGASPSSQAEHFLVWNAIFQIFLARGLECKRFVKILEIGLCRNAYGYASILALDAR